MNISNNEFPYGFHIKLHLKIVGKKEPIEKLVKRKIPTEMSPIQRTSEQLIENKQPNQKNDYDYSYDEDDTT